MKCPNCRCVIPDSSLVCRYCGYRLPAGRERTLTVREAMHDRQRGSRALYGNYYSDVPECNGGYGYYDGYYDAYGRNGSYGGGYANEYLAPEMYAAQPYGDACGFEYDDGYRDGYLDACGRSRQSSGHRSRSNKGYEREQTVSPAFLIAVLVLLLAVLGLLGFAVWNLM